MSKLNGHQLALKRKPAWLNAEVVYKIDYATYLKLKLLTSAMFYHIALRNTAKRWARKAVRGWDEKGTYRWVYQRKSQRDGAGNVTRTTVDWANPVKVYSPGKPGLAWENFEIPAHIHTWFQLYRRPIPVTDGQTVRGLHASQLREIDKLYDQLQERGILEDLCRSRAGIVNTLAKLEVALDESRATV